MVRAGGSLARDGGVAAGVVRARDWSPELFVERHVGQRSVPLAGCGRVLQV